MNSTIKEIARFTGVSMATVSKVLNGRPGFNAATVMKIKNIAEELGYFPYCKTRFKNVSQGNKKYIGIITTSEYGIRSAIDHAIEHFFAMNGYMIVRLVFNLSYNKIVDLDLFRKNVLENKDIAGVILITVSLSDKIVAELQNNGIPVVFVDKYTEYGKCVYIDNQKAASDAVCKLVSLNHKKIGYITPESLGFGYNVWEERFKGYKTGLKKCGLKYDPELVAYENTFNKEMVMALTKRLIDKNDEISAILYTSDHMAIPGMRAIIESGLKIPDDISVVGFDDMEFDEYLFPKLSSIRQPAYEMGEKAAKLLLKAITQKNYKHETFCLKPEFIMRESVGPKE